MRIPPATILLLAAGHALASDHADSQSVLATPEADINDLFAFTTKDHATLVLAMSVNRFANGKDIAGNLLGGRATFGHETLYSFHIDNAYDEEPGDSPAEHRIDIQFNIATPEQPGDSVIRISGLPSLGGGQPTLLALDADGRAERVGVRVFAGLRDDPFYLDYRWFLEFESGHSLEGLNDAVDYYHDGVPLQPAAPMDFFAGANVSMIVLEIPVADVRADDEEVLGVWASTSRVP